MLNWLVNRLHTTGTSREKLFIAQLICQTGSEQQADLLIDLAQRTPDLHLGIAELLLATGWRSNALQVFYRAALDADDGATRRAAFLGISAFAPDDLPAIARSLLHDTDVSVQQEAVLRLLQMGDPAGTEALYGLLGAPDAYQRAQAVRIIQEMGDAALLGDMLPLLNDSVDEVRLEVLHALDRLAQGKLSGEQRLLVLDALAVYTDDPVETVRELRVAVLSRLALPEAYRALLPSLADRSQLVCRAAVAALAAGGAQVAPLLEDASHASNSDLAQMATAALCHLHPAAQRLQPYIDQHLRQIDHIQRQIASFLPFERYPSARILCSSLHERCDFLLETIFYLLGSVHPPAALQVIAHSLSDASHRATALEALERLVGVQLAGAIGSLYQPHPPADITGVVWRIFGDSSEGNEWLRAVVVHFVSEAAGVLPPAERAELIDAALGDNSLEVRHAGVAGVADSGEIVMLSKVEKVIFLKQVLLFEPLSTQQLQIIADICEEVLFEKGDVLFAQGSPGDSMYVIVSGQVGVDVHTPSGEVSRLATRASYEAVGEMALFDSQPRSATLVALRDTLALRIDAAPMTRLARQYPDIALALVRVLSHRLREASDRIAALDQSHSHAV
jgi:HEAT repeat protein